MRSRHAVTWSQAGNALGVGYDSRIAYMKEKLGLVEKKEANWRMLEGNKREPWAAELYLRIMGWCGRDVRLDVDCFRSDPFDPRIGGSPDRIVVDEHTGEKWLLEIKTCPGGDMRTEIPITHLIQMWGLCHTYGLPKAHYICWSQHQGILISEITFDQRLTDFLMPLLVEFCDWWSLRALPPRLPQGQKQMVTDMVNEHCFISEINCVSRKRRQRELQQKGLSSSIPVLFGIPVASDHAREHSHYLGGHPPEGEDQ